MERRIAEVRHTEAAKDAEELWAFAERSPLLAEQVSLLIDGGAMLFEIDEPVTARADGFVVTYKLGQSYSLLLAAMRAENRKQVALPFVAHESIPVAGAGA